MGDLLLSILARLLFVVPAGLAFVGWLLWKRYPTKILLISYVVLSMPSTFLVMFGLSWFWACGGTILVPAVFCFVALVSLVLVRLPWLHRRRGSAENPFHGILFWVLLFYANILIGMALAFLIRHLQGTPIVMQ